MGLSAYRRAGRIAAKVRDETADRVIEGESTLDLAEWAENRIRELGGRPAFPVNFSINEVAAHYTPLPGDPLRIQPGDLVKIDVGVHVDGYIADTATTVDLGDHMDLTSAAEEALEAAIDVVKAGVRVKEIGRVVEEKAHSYGVKPVVDIGGHHLKRYNLHGGPNIPNYPRLLTHRLQEGDVIALEPFTTRGRGTTRKDKPTIYRLCKTLWKPPYLYNHIKQEYEGLPFARRWIEEDITNLIKSRAVQGYPVLVDIDGEVVAQEEHTLRVTRGGCEVLTRGD